jgi:2'-5' RNA ligase
VSLDEKWRLFFAVAMTDEVKARAAEVQRELGKVTGRVVKWVDPALLHITLKFVGWVPENRVEDCLSVGREIAAASRPCRLILAGAGAFPKAQCPRVLWIGAAGDVDILAAAAEALDRRMAEVGLAEPENRPFAAHLTLGRVRQDARPPDLTEALAAFADEQFGEVPVEEFLLMRSHLQPSGPVYEKIEAFSLPVS